MRRAAAFALIGLTTLLIIACSNDEPPPSVPVWTVVATHEVVLPDAAALVEWLSPSTRGRVVFNWSIEYVGPTGGIFTWTRVGTESGPAYECWQEARLGEPLPSCAGSEATDPD